MTSVGGTTLTTSTSGDQRSSETGWGGSGGYISPTYTIPSWQQGISMATNGGSTTQRNCPDVSMISDQFWIVFNNGASGGVGGTSGAAPLWAGYMALVNQQAAAFGKPTAGFINPAVYTIGKGPNYQANFYDITTGSNGKPAVSGYDLVTGWGTPNGPMLIASLTGTAGVGYGTVAAENQTVSFSKPVDAAYGANGGYLYKYAVNGNLTFSNTAFGGDPIFGVAKSGYSKPFTQCAAEGQSFTFTLPVEVAYGANGSYVYNRGVSGTVAFNNTTFTDPISGVVKAGYYMPYAWCAGEGSTLTFTNPVDLAYGASGHYIFRHAFTGTITFNNTTFTDPISGTAKAGYYRPSH